MYVIERGIPGAGSFSAEKLKSIAQTSCGVLSKMGPKIQWLHSYVTGDKIYCILCGLERGDGARTRQTGRLPGQFGERGHDDHQPGNGKMGASKRAGRTGNV